MKMMLSSLVFLVFTHTHAHAHTHTHTYTSIHTFICELKLRMKNNYTQGYEIAVSIATCRYYLLKPIIIITKISNFIHMYT